MKENFSARAVARDSFDLARDFVGFPFFTDVDRIESGQRFRLWSFVAPTS